MMKEWHIFALTFAVCAVYHGIRQVQRTKYLWSPKGEALKMVELTASTVSGVPPTRSRAEHIFGLVLVISARTVWRAFLWASIAWLLASAAECAFSYPHEKSN